MFMAEMNKTIRMNCVRKGIEQIVFKKELCEFCCLGIHKWLTIQKYRVY